MQFILRVLMIILLANSVYAETVQNTDEVSVSPKQSLDSSIAIGSASDWHLTPTEMVQYQNLMKGPNGQWYRQLTPPEVLGINASTEEERTHYAEIVAHQEHDKIARELIFDHAFHLAMQRLYGDEPIIGAFDQTPFTPIPQTSAVIHLETGDHVAVFLDVTKANFELAKLVRVVQNTPETTLDIYGVSTTDGALQQWANLNHIPVPLVKSGRITLNRDTGQLQAITKDSSLPCMVLVRGGKSTLISPETLQ